MYPTSVANFCVQLKNEYGVALDRITDEDVRRIVEECAYTTNEDDLSDRVAIEFGNMQQTHPQYGTLAARVLMAQLYLKTPCKFEDAMKTLHDDGVLADTAWEACKTNSKRIQDIFKRHRHADFNNFTYQGVNHLIKSYLLRNKAGVIQERPSYFMMRTAIGINFDDMDLCEKTFELLLDGTLTLASPIMFNSGSTMPQMASCFIQNINGTDVPSKYESLKETATIAAMNGGLGINVDGSDTQMFNIVVERAIKEVSMSGPKKSKRPGAGAIYREPWNADFIEILTNKLSKGGREDRKHKDLFIGMWTPSLFVERLRESATTGKKIMWSFFKGVHGDRLRAIHGKQFDGLYERLEKEKAYEFQMPVRKVFEVICEAYKETGVPFTLFKDIINRRSNHNNRGTIKGSNLCAEILEYSDHEETAVCTLASVCLSKFFKRKEPLEYDFDGLDETVRVAVRNLNKTIDLNKYPSKRAEKSHLSMRPIGIGPRDFQGLLLKAGLPFTSGPAKRLLDAVSAQIYWSALDESRVLAVKKGSYQHFKGSMYSAGILQQYTTHVKPDFSCTVCAPGSTCQYCAREMHLPTPNWEDLAFKIARDGLRNSLVTAAMPTVGTAQIFGHYESVDPMESMMFLSRVNSGNFTVVCEQLVAELEELGLWTPRVANELSANDGSLVGIDGIPESIREVYKTVWEVKQMERMKMSAIMGRYNDQGISFSVYLTDPTNDKYLTLLLFAHDCDLKTANYYHRSKPATTAKKVVAKSELDKQTPLKKDSSCVSCSS